MRAQARGYQIEIGKHREPQIVGYSQGYLEAVSPRRKQIEERLAEIQQTGAAAAQIAAHRRAKPKVTLTPRRSAAAASRDGGTVQHRRR